MVWHFLIFSSDQAYDEEDERGKARNEKEDYLDEEERTDRSDKSLVESPWN